MELDDRYDDRGVPEEGYEHNVMGRSGQTGVFESDIDVIIEKYGNPGDQ